MHNNINRLLLLHGIILNMHSAGIQDGYGIPASVDGTGRIGGLCIDCFNHNLWQAKSLMRARLLGALSAQHALTTFGQQKASSQSSWLVNAPYVWRRKFSQNTRGLPCV